MASSPIIRIRLIAFGFFMLAVLLVVRLFFIQVINGEVYQDRAARQYANTGKDLYNRGSIYFQRKDGQLVSAADIKEGFTLVIHPDKIKDADYVYESLSKYISIDKEDFYKRAGKSDDPYEKIADRVEESIAYKISDLDLDGVSLKQNRWRYYPGGDIASHVLGFVGYSGNDYSGRYGVERYYNNVLERDGGAFYENFFAQIFSGISDVVSDDIPNRQGDIILTIEPIVQGFIENELSSLMKEQRPDEVGIIVMDPLTGEIISMAARPTFSPGSYNEEKNISVFSNPLVESIYEVGSIVKPLTIAAALDAGAISESDTYDDRGFVIVDDARISNFDGRGRGVIPIQEILNQSLNTGAVFVMQELGKKNFREYMFAYGLGEKTQIDLPDEVSGQVGNLEKKGNVEYATASFGQGIAMSPINITRALASLANGGVLVRPHVVSEFNYDGLPKRTVHTEEQGKVLKKETSQRISRMLTTVVDDSLRDGKVALPRYTIAAKTGTAQIPAPDGGYYEDRFLHSFFGYFPAFDPEYIVYLYMVNPKVGRYSSQTLTDPFMDITKFLLNYYEIPPDR